MLEHVSNNPKQKHPPKQPLKTKPVSIGFISLGCPKNLVDLQIMGAALHEAGFNIGVDVDVADVILVNTCAFIEEAREEAVSSILGACELKKTGACQAVIVTGCLSQRYGKKVVTACPGVDAVLGVDDLDRIPEIVRQTIEAKSTEAIISVSTPVPTQLFTSKIPSLILTGGPFAYLKIAEGCQHRCAFCAIPGIRGGFRSRTINEIVQEARAILAEGIREINLIAQDTTSYGSDLKDNTTLAELLRRLDALDGDFWIRMLYGYPGMLTDELLDVIASSQHICHYLDIPIQHSHPDILRAMRRADTLKFIPTITTTLREKIPDVVLRTTCLVGFPGETNKHFTHLLDFIGKETFDHLGTFTFSPETGTPAYTMPDDPDDIIAEKRRQTLMTRQAEIVRKRLKKSIGTHTRILLETPIEEEDTETTNEIIWEGRTSGQAPDDIDGVSYVYNVPDTAQPGDFIEAEIIDFDAYDLICEYRAT